MMRRIVSLIILSLVSCFAFAQGSTLKDGMDAITEHYGVHFAYDSSLPVDTPVPRQSFKGKSLRSSLRELFSDTDIEWRVKGRYVMLTAAKSLSAELVQVDTIKAATITGIIDRNMNSTQTGLTRLDGAAFSRAFAVFSSPDVVKTLQALPGVASGTELLSKLYVHGGDGSDNLFLLDGVPLYQICHLGGIFSSFNTDVIETLDFYKSGFPAQFGGRTSSVVDIKTKPGDFSKFRGKVSFGSLETRLQFEGPIVKDKTSFNIALRRTLSDAIMYSACLIKNKKDNKNNKDPHNTLYWYSFTDLNAKVSHKFEENNLLTANFYYGGDVFRYREELPRSYSSVLSGSSEVYKNNDLEWGNKLASLEWKKGVSDNLSFDTAAYWSESASGISNEYEMTTKIKYFGEKLDLQESSSLYNHNIIDDFGLTSRARWKVDDMNRISAGGEFIWHLYRPDYSSFKYYKEDDLEIKSELCDTIRTSCQELSIYAQDEISFNSIFKAVIGVRNTLYIYSGKLWNSFEPRAALKIQCLPDLGVKLSYSKMSQFSHEIASTYLDLPTNCWLPSDDRVPPVISHQVAAGIYCKLPENLHLTVETWYKTMDNLIEYAGPSSLYAKINEWESFYKVGKGRSFGVELDTGYETDRLTVNLFYTLSWSQRLFTDIWQDWYRDRNDSRHKITVQANWRINDKWEVYGAWNFHSGNRITVPVQYLHGYYTDYDLMGAMWVYREPNNVKIPAYHRLDIGANLHGKTKRGNDWAWNFSIYNAYCHINAIYAMAQRRGIKRNETTFDPGYVSFVGVGYGIVPILPSVSYTLKF